LCRLALDISRQYLLLISTFQDKFHAPYLGVGIGIIQAFLSFMFWRIDQRNRYLTKHSENIIKQIENDCNQKRGSYGKLFVEEEIVNELQKNEDKKKLFLFRKLSHGQSYKVIYLSFFVIGIIGSIISLIYANNSLEKSDNNDKNKATITIDVPRLDSIETKIFNNNDTRITSISQSLVKLSNKIDSLNLELTKNKINHTSKSLKKSGV